MPDDTHNIEIIDAHCHAGKGMRYGDPHGAPWETFNDPDWLLRLADEAGISRCVIFPINNLTYEAANEEIASYVAAHPDRFIGFAKHDAKSEAGRIGNMLTHEVNDMGLQGLKCHGEPSEEMCEAAQNLSIPLLMHQRNMDDAIALVAKYPKLNFILAHLGSFRSRPYTDHLKAIEHTLQYDNLYMDTSAVVFFPYLEKAARELPATKLLFGSDGPLVDPRSELHKISLLPLSRADRELVLGKNIRRLIGEEP